MVLGGGNDLGIWRKALAGSSIPDGALCVNGSPVCTIDDVNICVDAGSAPVKTDFTITDGNDAGAPPSLTVTLELTGSIIYDNGTTAALLTGVISDPSVFTVSGEGTDTVVFSFPRTFDTDTLEVTFVLDVDGWPVTFTHSVGGVRITNYDFVGTTKNFSITHSGAADPVFANTETASGDFVSAPAATPASNNPDGVLTYQNANTHQIDLTKLIDSTFNWPILTHLRAYDIGTDGGPATPVLTAFGGSAVLAGTVGNNIGSSVDLVYNPSESNVDINSTPIGTMYIWPDGYLEWELL